VELTLAASGAIDDGLFVLSSGIAASNLGRSEHPNTTVRQVAQFIWHLVEGQGCRRQAAYRGAFTKLSVSASFAEKGPCLWEPIFKRAGPHVKMLTRISDPEM
jgi:hypothetical protein